MANLKLDTENLLNLSNLQLGRIFDMDGKQARQRIEMLLLKGNNTLEVIEPQGPGYKKKQHYSD